MFTEDDYLMISAIQHFVFCRRQWALIHLEGLWEDNFRTIEGNFIHERCHDDTFTEKRGKKLISRGIRVFSSVLGVTGQCDVVEFEKSTKGARLFGRDGLWSITPIEYKRGKDKDDLSDILQLTCQAECLTEMFCQPIPYGYLYYAEIGRRKKIEFTAELKEQLRNILKLMHEMIAKGHTPKVKTTAKCRGCSIKDICLPKLNGRVSVKSYYGEFLGDD